MLFHTSRCGDGADLLWIFAGRPRRKPLQNLALSDQGGSAALRCWPGASVGLCLWRGPADARRAARSRSVADQSGSRVALLVQRLPSSRRSVVPRPDAAPRSPCRRRSGIRFAEPGPVHSQIGGCEQMERKVYVAYLCQKRSLQGPLATEAFLDTLGHQLSQHMPRAFEYGGAPFNLLRPSRQILAPVREFRPMFFARILGSVLGLYQVSRKEQNAQSLLLSSKLEQARRQSAE